MMPWSHLRVRLLYQISHPICQILGLLGLAHLDAGMDLVHVGWQHDLDLLFALQRAVDQDLQPIQVIPLWRSETRIVWNGRSWADQERQGVEVMGLRVLRPSIVSVLDMCT